jgi:hypothetical protein
MVGCAIEIKQVGWVERSETQHSQIAGEECWVSYSFNPTTGLVVMGARQLCQNR